MTDGRTAVGDLRAGLASAPTTLAVVGLLAGWFVVSRAVAAAFGPEAYVFLVVATATPSPGWLLAAATHTGVGHLASNALPFVVWGGVTERFLGGRRYLALVVLAGVGGVLAQVLVYLARGVVGGIVGASAATQAVVAFAVVAPVVTGRHVVETPGMGTGLALGGAVMLVGQTLNDFTPVVSFVPDAAGVSHVVGAMVGVSYAVVWGLGRDAAAPETARASDR